VIPSVDDGINKWLRRATQFMRAIFVIYAVLTVLCGTAAALSLSTYSHRPVRGHGDYPFFGLAMIGLCIILAPGASLSYVCWLWLRTRNKAAIVFGIIVNLSIVLWLLTWWVLRTQLTPTPLLIFVLPPCVVHGLIVALLVAGWGTQVGNLSSRASS
jgi:hypothetical protein